MGGAHRLQRHYCRLCTHYQARIESKGSITYAPGCRSPSRQTGKRRYRPFRGWTEYKCGQFRRPKEAGGADKPERNPST